MDAQEELAFLRSVAASQLQTIKTLTLGCEKYGLTETTPIVRHLAAQDDEIERLRAELAECREDAERWRYLRDDGCGFEITVREENEDGYESWVAGYPAEELDAAIDTARKGEGE